jgi:hypothetical protein
MRGTLLRVRRGIENSDTDKLFASVAEQGGIFVLCLVAKLVSGLCQEKCLTYTI